MKNGKLFLMITVLLPIAVQAQQDKKSIRQGNEYYRQQQYDDAATAYQQSLSNGHESVVGNFNLGAAWYKQKKLDDAIQQFTDIAGSATDKAVKAKAYHNLGNSLLESQKLEESIEAYKKSLLNNPKDDETRYNLAYAQEKLKQQQQQENKDNQDKNKNNQDQENKDNQNQDNEDKDKDNKDQENKDNKDQNNDNKDQDNGKDDQQQSQPGQLSKADAERLLEAMNQEEKNTQEKLKKKKGTGQGKVVKQW